MGQGSSDHRRDSSCLSPSPGTTLDTHTSWYRNCPFQGCEKTTYFCPDRLSSASTLQLISFSAFPNPLLVVWVHLIPLIQSLGRGNPQTQQRNLQAQWSFLHEMPPWYGFATTLAFKLCQSLVFLQRYPRGLENWGRGGVSQVNRTPSL